MGRYSLEVANKQAILHRTKSLGIPLGNWFVSPLHPITENLERWHYQPGQCPVAEQACAEAVNLFTDHPLASGQLEQLFTAATAVRLARGDA